MLDIDIEMRKGIMFVRMGGTFNNDTVEKWNDNVKSLIVDNGVKNIVYNVSNLKDVDAKGINSFLYSYEFCKSNHGTICICGLNDNVRNKFRRNRLLKYITEIDNELSALSIVNG